MLARLGIIGVVLAVLFISACSTPSSPPDPADAGHPGAGGDIVDLTMAVGAQNIAATAEWVYWLGTTDQPRLGRVPVNGGATDSIPVLEPGQWGGGLTVTAEAVFFGDADGLRRTTRELADLTTLVPGAEVTDVAVQGGWVYWTEHNGNRLRRVPSGGGAPEDLAVGHVITPSALVADESHVYWINRDSGVLLRANPDGSAAEELTSWSGDNSFELVANDTHLFWPNAATGELLERAKAGGDTTVLATEQYFYRAVIAGDWIYLNGHDSSGHDALVQVNVNDGHSEVVVKEEALHAFAVEDGWVFWAASGTGAIRGLRR